MSSPLQIGKGVSTSSTSASPTQQSPVVASSSTTDTPPPPPPLPPLFLASQSGDLNALHQLLPPRNDSDEATTSTGVSANDRDPQGITALHWAAINNHLLACKLLLERGAEVDAVGGDLMATPLHWAARNGHLYIVHLLLNYNADPNLLDSQSFNALHLAVHSSSAFLLAYMLFTSQPIAVDSADTEGHTSLHWACYQGDAISVDLLLRAGADPRRPDNAGLTPLHWAAVKGNAACIKRLIEAGADIATREKQGKTARDMAAELKSLAAFKRGLLDAGHDEDGRLQVGTLSPRNTTLAILAIPSLAFFLILNTLAILPWWSGLLLAFGEFFGMHHVISKVLLGVKGPHNSDRITKSPYLCSIIVASIVWVSYVWLTRFITVPGYAVSNLLMGLSLLVCAYNFFRAITLDPGHIPFATNDMELKETVEELVETGSFNGMSFCLTCLVRRPLRSKHSYVTKRCVARFDHYCPWVWNDVGVNNHRQFLLFVTTLVIGVTLFLRLAVGYFSALPSPPPSTPDSPSTPETTCIIPGPLCTAATADTFALSMVLWATLQLTWTLILLGAQLWQICRQMTTLEVSNVGRYGYMGGKPGISAPHQQGAVAKWEQGKAAAESLGDVASEPQGDGEHVHGSGCEHRRKKSAGAGGAGGKASFLLKILGIDRFTRGKAAEGLAHAGEVPNPFDLGFYGNCVDFWTRGRELGVTYERLYEVPDGGFARAVRERKRREKDGKASEASREGQRKGKGRAVGGYERLDMRDSLEERERVVMDEV